MAETGAVSQTLSVFDGAALRRLGRAVPHRFAIDLVESDRIERLEVLEVRRLLPGRRIAARARLAGGRAVHAKIFFGPAAERDRARELDGAALLASAHVPTPAVMTVARGTGVEAVLFEQLEPVRPLGRAELPAAAALLARLHAAGVLHEDLKPDNLLVDRDGAVHVVDAGSVVVRGSPPVAASRLAQLARLLAEFGIDGAAHAGAVAVAYDAAAGASLATRDAAALGRAFDAALERRVDRYVDKSLRDCTEFRVEKRFDRLVVCRREWWDGLADVLARPDAAIEAATSAGSIVKRGNTATVARLTAGGRRLVIKRYNLKSTRHALSRALRPSRAAHAWRNGHRLRMLGIATANPVALVEERLGPLRRRAYLLLEEVQGRSLAAVDPMEHVDAVVDLFRRLRRAGLVHGDTKATNFVVATDGLTVLDLDAMRRPRTRRLRERGHARDIERFCANWPKSTALPRVLVAAGL